MKATKIIAKRKSLCPRCRINIYPGVPCQVYDNKWYHVECWQEKWDEIAKEKDEVRLVQELTDHEIIDAKVEDISKVNDKYIEMETKQLEVANEIRHSVLQIEILTGRMREIAKELGSW